MRTILITAVVIVAAIVAGIGIILSIANDINEYISKNDDEGSESRIS